MAIYISLSLKSNKITYTIGGTVPSKLKVKWKRFCCISRKELDPDLDLFFGGTLVVGLIYPHSIEEILIL